MHSPLRRLLRSLIVLVAMEMAAIVGWSLAAPASPVPVITAPMPAPDLASAIRTDQ